MRKSDQEFEYALKELSTLEGKNRAFFTRFLKQYIVRRRKSSRRKKKAKKRKEKRGLFGFITPGLILGAGLSIIALIRHIRKSIDESGDFSMGDFSLGQGAYGREDIIAGKMPIILAAGFPNIAFSPKAQLTGLDPDLVGLLGLFDKYNVPVYVSSAVRSASQHVGYGYATSPHNSGRAIDIIPKEGHSFAQLREAIRNNIEIANYMVRNSINVLDETNPYTLARTGGTGEHFHIEKSSGSKKQTLEDTERFWRGSTYLGERAGDTRTVWEQQGFTKPAVGSTVEAPATPIVNVPTKQQDNVDRTLGEVEEKKEAFKFPAGQGSSQISYVDSKTTATIASNVGIPSIETTVNVSNPMETTIMGDTPGIQQYRGSNITRVLVTPETTSTISQTPYSQSPNIPSVWTHPYSFPARTASVPTATSSPYQPQVPQYNQPRQIQPAPSSTHSPTGQNFAHASDSFPQAPIHVYDLKLTDHSSIYNKA